MAPSYLKPTMIAQCTWKFKGKPQAELACHLLRILIHKIVFTGGAIDPRPLLFLLKRREAASQTLLDWIPRILVPRFWYQGFSYEVLITKVVRTRFLVLRIFVPGSWYQEVGTKNLVPASWYQVVGTKLLAPKSCLTLYRWGKRACRIFASRQAKPAFRTPVASLAVVVVRRGSEMISYRNMSPNKAM